ncbi:MAG: MFS transporter [Gammaproteobacteria bacterium]|nr:MAG: MFS transporter [Gammaproteobacteria bacterium]
MNLSFLEKKNTVAKPGYNRWLFPPAALCIHLSIGQVYAFSVFNLPLSRVVGVSESVSADWELTTIGWIFSTAIFFLGLSAAIGGRWLEKAGPRKAMLASALCFAGGFYVSALGVQLHAIWLVYLGYGVLGGIGLGLGYISPVHTLIDWFPDRPGMATGLAIMGFGGGAMIGSPLAVGLMDYYATPTSVGVANTLLTMGTIYLVFMLIGSALVKIPPKGWLPRGYTPPKTDHALVTTHNVLVSEAVKTPQFYLLWGVLCMNVTAGIGVLGQASVMSQEMFPGRVTVQMAAGFVGLLSLFNMAGRFIWSSASDYLGRKRTYTIYFLLGMVLYALVPTTGQMGSITLFVIGYLVIMSMYGGGFATVPAYLRDLFGTENVGAIHGRLLTAWSVAGILGPVLVNYIREYQINSGVPRVEAYTVTMYIMAGLLVIGLLCNLAVKPVDARYHAKVP